MFFTTQRLLQIYGVQAYSNVGAAPFYKELADRTNGGYLKFDNFSLIKDMFLAGEPQDYN